MASIAIKRVSELSEPIKAAIESLLGRRLSGQEQISVMALEGHQAPSGPERRVAAAQLNQVLERMADRALDVSTEEFEATVDEAMSQVRLWPE